jgi:hypothetical protein
MLSPLRFAGEDEHESQRFCVCVSRDLKAVAGGCQSSGYVAAVTMEGHNEMEGFRIVKCLIDWLNEEPNVKDAKYDAANAWGNTFIDEHLKDGAQPDEKVADVIYDHAVAELEDSTDAFNSLSSKCNDLMKLLVAIVGVFVALWRYSATLDHPLLSEAQWLIITTSNFLAAIGICLLVVAMTILATCLRGMQYIPRIDVKKLIEWAGDKENASYIKMRASVRMARAMVGNRNVNDWIHRRTDLAWIWTIVGLFVMASSVALRLFA